MEELTPQEIVKSLDKYIIGQSDAKKSVAVAIRNRYRRKKLPAELKDEVVPKNILMMGPTGVGKTEIARRLAKLVQAPFIKVEVTKFTEVGYVGRDVESMVRDLLQTAIRMVKKEKMERVEDKAIKLAEERIIDLLLPRPKKRGKNPFGALFGEGEGEEEDNFNDEQEERFERQRNKLCYQLRLGELDDRIVEVEIEDTPSQMVEIFSGAGVEEMGVNFQDIFGGMFPNQKKKRKVTIEEAKVILKEEEAHKLIDMDEVSREAIKRVEESGIIFLDEIDKIAGQKVSSNADVSRGGVQRDILPIVEGSTVMTKYGPVRTDHILFIAAGAFHVASPTDLIPELQGRFPIRVELNSLSKEDFKEILIKPQNALIKQYKALLKTEDVDITFTKDAIDELAEIAFRVNEQTENIGARRLHTIIEKLLEELSFKAPEIEEKKIVIDKNYVKDKLDNIVEDKDLSKYIL
ncbi:ATP-dependent HslUV protease ATP-binding subunit HslU [Orenia metallireducens]|jgi:ATP-dependent HslUV protease ATP-binding subunit HslU|uniref:ATP-dependent protease ATPase subunit HslU n=1 Tax=Orenia metallireducens TaxID=1413210 RepID=A0A285FPX5_9FIRM|nr:ATP-dependent protease ATPase subunit HslU [Orenia metallireducens]PRX33683.1 ATP-dependent HslUV protease ATP-binding subunit HslU [Orenia metallireducens]SNY13362.1 ATP-dependent HslUV protease ATP-binding subunit HslU [Orenia metallireducens]